MPSAAPTTIPFVPDGQNTRLLRDAFGRFATGVTIVTTATQSGVIAITANSFSSVSLTPPLVLWSPSKSSTRFKHFENAENFAIHVLAAEQGDLCWQVAKNAHALDGLQLQRNPEGAPILQGCIARFECTKSAIYEGGDHVIVLGHVDRAEMRQEGEPLAFYKGQMGRFTAH